LLPEKLHGRVYLKPPRGGDGEEEANSNENI